MAPSAALKFRLLLAVCELEMLCMQWAAAGVSVLCIGRSDWKLLRKLLGKQHLVYGRDWKP